MAEKKTKIAPVENPELEKVIASLKEGNSPEKQTALIVALQKARLLAPCDFDVPIRPGEKAHPNQIKFYLVHTNDGKTLFPAFTNVSKSQKFRFEKENQPKLVVRRIKDYLQLVMDKRTKAEGVVINPGSDNIVIPKGMILRLSGARPEKAGQPSAQKGTAPMNVTYGEPSVYPTRLVNAVYERCEQSDAIHRVWLKGKFTGPVMSFFLIVDCDPKDEAVLNEIREAAVPLAKNVPVEVVFFTDDLNKNVIKDSVALYDDALEL